MLEEQLAQRPRSSAVRLECSGGQTLHGEVVRYQAQSRTVLLSHQGTLSWVDLNQVVAVTLVHAESWLQELTRGRVRGAQEPVPTRLQLRRRADQLAKHLLLTRLEIPWPQLPDDDQSSHHLHIVLQEIDECWEQISRDEMGKKALATIREVILEFSKGDGQVVVEQGQCRICVGAGADGLVAFSPGDLKKKLESAL